jgi:hypothetical protein
MSTIKLKSLFPFTSCVRADIRKDTLEYRRVIDPTLHEIALNNSAIKADPCLMVPWKLLSLCPFFLFRQLYKNFRRRNVKTLLKVLDIAVGNKK